MGFIMNDLPQSPDSIEREIERLQEKLQEAKKLKMEATLQDYGVKIVCHECYGTGEYEAVWDGDLGDCPYCDGRGYYMAIKWVSKNMDIPDEVISAVEEMEGY